MEYTSIYGYIKISRDYEASARYIKNLETDATYPFITANMFSAGENNYPYYYENVMISFAATYKYFGDTEDWNYFILKMENILRNMDFENAQFHVESSIGDYTLFWTRHKPYNTSAKEEEKYIEEYRLTKTDEWYFGFGKRSVFTGYPDNESPELYEDLRNHPDMGFTYPVKQSS